jgi:hypothetical protein
MKTVKTFGLVVLAAVVVLGINQVSAEGPVALKADVPTGGGSSIPPWTGGTDATEPLFRGDMIPEQGLGCATNPAPIVGGGPNDFAVGVSATLTPPFGITSTTYNVFTGSSTAPTLTALTFKAWQGGGTPGPEIGAQAGMSVADGDHTIAIAPAIVVNSAAFYIGLLQPQTDSGIRIGLDTTSSAGTSFIRAPDCGATLFTSVDTLGFPGNWVIRAVIDDTIPVELQTFTVN